jgi:hypothetical protein
LYFFHVDYGDGAALYCRLYTVLQILWDDTLCRVVWISPPLGNYLALSILFAHLEDVWAEAYTHHVCNALVSVYPDAYLGHGFHRDILDTNEGYKCFRLCHLGYCSNPATHVTCVNISVCKFASIVLVYHDLFQITPHSPQKRRDQ